MTILPVVTLVAIDTKHHELTKLAINDCRKHCTFADILIFSDKPIAIPFAGWFQVPAFTSMQTYTEILWQLVWRKVQTPHFLVVQWDGWVVEPKLWTDEFLKYDYIGAPWSEGDVNGYRVGNGGFSLRSVDMARYISGKYPMPVIGEPEDVTICQRYRRGLEDKGFKWHDGLRLGIQVKPPVAPAFGSIRTTVRDRR
jgi:hypothetical protein